MNPVNATSQSQDLQGLLQSLVPVVNSAISKAGITVSPNTIMQVVRIAMEAVEGAPIKGQQQRDLVISLVLEVAKNAGLSNEDIMIIQALINGGMMSDTIDLVVSASKGQLNVNQIEKVTRGCLSCIPVIQRLVTRFRRGNRTADVQSEAATTTPTSVQAITQANATSQVNMEPVVIAESNVASIVLTVTQGESSQPVVAKPEDVSVVVTDVPVQEPVTVVTTQVQEAPAPVAQQVVQEQQAQPVSLQLPVLTRDNGEVM